MKKMINQEVVAGYVYQLCDSNGRNKLELKTVKNEKSENFGKEFIGGTIAVAVDEDGLNIIEVHYSYVTPTTKNGSTNSTFTNLKKIITEGKTWLECGKDATKVKLEPALALNDFVTKENEIASAKINEGGFVTIINELPPESERNCFTTDMVITRVTHVEADPEKNIDNDYVVLRGAVFNFRGEVLPVDFLVKNPAGMEHFESMDISSSNPVLTKVWGRINCETKTTVKEEESAFGSAAVKTYTRKTKEYIVTGTAKSPYEFGEEGVLTVDELQKAMQDREVHLAEVRKKDDEYKTSRNTPAAAPASAKKVPTGDFKF